MQSLYTRDALEARLTRWMLSLTPAQRLALAEDCANAVAAFRGDESQLPPEVLRERDRNELRLLRRTLEESRKK